MISTVDGLLSAMQSRVKQARIEKTATRTSVAATWFSVFDIAGRPGAGTLAGSNTAAGIVPNDTVAGYPAIPAFTVPNKGYLAGVSAVNTVPSTLVLFDRLWVAGAYAFNANVALSSQPSIAARVPDGDYSMVEAWVEQVTAATGNQAVTLTYMDESGATGRSTGAVGVGAAPTVGRCWPMPLQSGDRGVQRVDNVLGTVATVGTFNVMLLRRLWEGRISSANALLSDEFTRTYMEEIFETSALYMLVSADSTSTGLPSINPRIVQG